MASDHLARFDLARSPPRFFDGQVECFFAKNVERLTCGRALFQLGSFGFVLTRM